MRKAKCIISMFLMILFCGCSRDKDNQIPMSLGIVAGTHANSYIPNYENPKVINYIEQACKSYGHISVVIADGNPYIPVDTLIMPPSKDVSGEKKRQIAEEQASTICSIFTKSQAVTEEVDLLKAIEYAARGINSIDTSNRVLVIMDSGLSTSGALNFASSGLPGQDAENYTEQVLKHLKDNNVLNKNLEDIVIYWLGLGDVSSPQKPLSNGQISVLKSLWKKILNEMGAKKIVFMTDNPSGLVAENLPSVSEVKQEQVSDFDYFDPKEAAKREIIKYIYDENRLPFVANSDAYLDYTQAQKELEPIARLLIEHPDKKVVLAGTTAKDGSTQEECALLSLKRASQVKSTLIELGVDDRQLLIAGLGYENPYHINEYTEQGCFIEQIAKTNRLVIILDADTEEAEYILNSN